MFKNDSLVSRAIRYIETGQVGRNVPNHIAIVLNVFDNDVELIEATIPKVRIVKLSHYKGCTVWHFRIKSPCDINKGINWAISKLGEKYDITALIGILFQSVGKWIEKKLEDKVKILKNLFENRRRFFCSEFVMHYGKESGKTLWHQDPSDTTPYDLFRSKELELLAYSDTLKKRTVQNENKLHVWLPQITC